MENICNNCIYCETEDDTSYCLIRDLYYFINLTDEACEDFVSRSKGND